MGHCGGLRMTSGCAISHTMSEALKVIFKSQSLIQTLSGKNVPPHWPSILGIVGVHYTYFRILELSMSHSFALSTLVKWDTRVFLPFPTESRFLSWHYRWKTRETRGTFAGTRVTDRVEGRDSLYPDGPGSWLTCAPRTKAQHVVNR